jgi:hypothetical protein
LTILREFCACIDSIGHNGRASFDTRPEINKTTQNGKTEKHGEYDFAMKSLIKCNGESHSRRTGRMRAGSEPIGLAAIR